MSRNVLVVEDNPITRKMLRLALQAEGYVVLEAEDGRTALQLASSSRPDLVLQDLVLPDMDGLELLAQLRRLPGGEGLPILALSGLVSRLEELSTAGAGFSGFVPKPVEASRVVAVVGQHLAVSAAGGLAHVRGQRVLLVEPEPARRGHVERQLRSAGFSVAAVGGLDEALAEVRRRPPHAVLSAAVLPERDGFQLCRVLRSDPLLRRLPVVLIADNGVAPADHVRARDAGATGLVPRSAELREAVDALVGGLAAVPHAPRAPTSDAPAPLAREPRSLQAAALWLMHGMAEVFSHPRQVDGVLNDVLVQSLEAVGLSAGLLYLCEPDGRLRLQVQCGLDASAREAAEVAFGEEPWLREAMRLGAHAVARDAGARSSPSRLLDALGHEAVLIVPLVVLGDLQGVLVLAADRADAADQARLSFARALAGQFGQAIALGRAVSSLSASERRYRTLVEASPIGIVHFDARGRLLDANPAFEALVARPVGELRENDVAELVQAEDRAELDTLLAELARAPQARLERHVRLCGPQQRTVWARLLATAIQDEHGLFEHGVALVEDVTEQRRLEDELRHAQKMEALGRLAGGVAHDFNNVLTAILGHADLLVRRGRGDAELQRRAGEILKAAQRAAGVTRQLLAFGRKQVVALGVLDVGEAVSQLVQMLRHLVGEDLQFESALPSGRLLVRADRGLLDQVLINLVVNARDAMPAGGVLRLEVGTLTCLDSRALSHGLLEPGEHVWLEVTDTGAGMDSETLSRMFEPFFTTKPPGKGTGLGLATVYAIVQQCRGGIDVESALDRGTRVTVYLPRAGDDESLARLREPSSADASGSERILLLDDEPMLRDMARDILESSGYTVFEVATAAQALELLASDAGAQVELLVTDVVMPGMNGREVAARALELRPGLRVLYISGYTEDVVLLRGVDTAGQSFLQKPFSTESLTRAVRDLLDGAPPA